MKYYAGIGSRETPSSLQPLIDKIVDRLSEYTLRSGGAPGADSMFEKNAINKEIFLPWKDFNNNESLLFKITPDAYIMAKKYHPRYDTLSDGAKNMMARNCYQVLGFDLNTPVDFIICWTKDGKNIGGTSQALRIAQNLDIPIFNLYFDDCYKKLIQHLNPINLF